MLPKATIQILEDLEKGNTGQVPNHIKTHSKDYLYPHNYPNNYVKQQYLPDKIKNKKYYYPASNKYENNLNKIHQDFTKW